MPQFILNAPPSPQEIRTAVANYGAKPRKPHSFYDLNEFARGYVEAMFFTNGDTGDERENLLNDWGVERLTRAAVAAIKADCEAFERDAADLLALAYATGDYEPEQAGRDFWFTRQGHGVGFWEREALNDNKALWREMGSPRVDEPGWKEYEAAKSETLGERLSEVARKAGESYVEAYRGWIYVR